MPTDIVMPNLGFDAQTGVLVEWLKQPGDAIKRGEVIAVVESDKANVELESIASGIVLEHLFGEQQEVPVGAVIARVGAADEQPQAAAQPTPTATSVVDASPVAKRMAAEHRLDLSQIQGTGRGGRITRGDIERRIGQAPSTASTSGNGRILALPKVRKAAREAGVDLHAVAATGKHGEVTLWDLEAYLEGERETAPVPLQAIPKPIPQTIEEAPAPSRSSAPSMDGTRIEQSRMRQTIGRRLQQSKQDAPHFYVTGEFDLEPAIAKLAAYPDPQPRINDLIQFVTVQALLQVPELNATYQNDELIQYPSVNLAVAVARDDGLITPVLHNAHRYSIRGLSEESRALISRTRDNRLQAQDLQGGTFTISNLGIIRQVDHFTAVINPPQVAILAVGTVKPRPMVIDGGLHIRRTVQLTLSGDHRVVDGMHLGRFMAAWQDELDRL